MSATAHAAVDQESTFQDDDQLIFNTPARTAKALDALAQLGVSRVRVSVFWATVAPESGSRSRPSFDAADPDAYPPGSWDRYDQLVELAGARHIGVNFNITSPAPLWATDPSSPREDIAHTWQPSPDEFAKFVQAVGRRYDGSAHPRVSYWSIWNEPNQPGWLTPQWIGNDQSGWVAAAPRLYRGLVDAARVGLVRSGHADDTLLIGETAPKGLRTQGTTAAIKALQFVRELYCVDANDVPYTGDAAKVRDCPADPSAFAGLHPALFGATGYAHHPYALTTSPAARPTDPDFATMANLGSLDGTLDRIFAAYGKADAVLPLYLTEFGYNTEPPNPAGVSPAGQARYLNQAEFIARQNPSVRTFAQFLLVDSAQKSPASAGYGVTFQTGLKWVDGRRKPAYAAYELPVWLPRAKVTRGKTLRVWGLVRPAPQIGAAQRVRIRIRYGKRTRPLKTVRTGQSGVLDLRVRFRHSGTLTLAWTDPRTSKTVVSRGVTVTVRRARARR